MEHSIFSRIEKAKSPDFGDILSKSIELYQKAFSQGITHTLISLVVIIPFFIVIYIPIFLLYFGMIQQAVDPYYDPYYYEPSFLMEQFSVVMLVVWFVVIFVLAFLMQLVTMSIFGHFFKTLKKMDYNTNEDIGGYFTLLKNHFGKMLLLTLASMGIALLAALLCYLPVFYVMVPLHWIFPIFVFNEKLSVSDIIKAAFRFANKNWLTFAGLGLIVSMMASLGTILCYIGMILTLFFTYIATYVAYRDTIGFETENPAEEDPLLLEA